MPNVIAALSNIGGALCSTPQRLAGHCGYDGHAATNLRLTQGGWCRVQGYRIVHSRFIYAHRSAAEPPIIISLCNGEVLIQHIRLPIHLLW